MAEDVAARDVLDDARALAGTGEWSKLVALVTSLHPADLAELVLLFDEDERVTLLDRLPTDVVGQLFEFAEDDELRNLIRGVGVQDLPAVLEEVDDDVAADVIQQLLPAEQLETLAALDRGEEVAELMRYNDETAGGIMSRGFVALNEGISVQQAIDYFRVLRPPTDRAYYLYVIDDERRLQGTVSVRDLLVSSPRTTLSEITQRDVHAVAVGTDQEEVARTLQKYNLMAVPVVDEDGRLEGVTTVDDLMDVIQEEATEDMFRMVGLDEEETASTPMLQTIRLRLPWLIVNLGTAFVSTVVLLAFQGTVDKALILVAFVPAIANQAGVTGSQTSTIAVRSLALREQRVPLRRLLLREWAVGVVNGLVVGLILASVAFLIEGNLALSLILLVAMTGATSLAAPLGQAVPLVLRLFRADPALSSSIFVTMCTDGISYFMAFALAAVMISQLT